jgi:NIMA-interacting peptidyl-prolyl cis-trans isomerase 1
MELPVGWEVRECKDYPGRCYYYNSLTDQSTWIRPSTSPPPFIYLSHITVKHAGSRNTRGRGNLHVTRSADSAREKMGNIRADLVRDQSRFNKIATDESDIGAADGGLLGWVRPDDLPPDFAKVAWALAVGEMSEVF